MGIIKRKLIIDDESTDDYCLLITGTSTHDTGTRSVTTYSVAGRNGVLVKDEKTYGTVDVTYHAYLMVPTFKKLAYIRRIRHWLLKPGIRKIIDTQQPDEEREGWIAGPLTFTPGDANKICEFDIKITMQPQRFVKESLTLKEIKSGDKFENPTGETALPLLRLYGNGQLTFVHGNTYERLTVTDAPRDYTDVDCETMDAFYGDSENLNGHISVAQQILPTANEIFPKFPEGITEVTFNGFSKVKIAPRFFWI